jgi:hypothetical protein
MGIAELEPRQLAPTVGTTRSGSTGSPALLSLPASTRSHLQNYVEKHRITNTLRAPAAVSPPRCAAASFRPQKARFVPAAALRIQVEAAMELGHEGHHEEAIERVDDLAAKSEGSALVLHLAGLIHDAAWRAFHVGDKEAMTQQILGARIPRQDQQKAAAVFA